jgi:hypothetical protein
VVSTKSNHIRLIVPVRSVQYFTSVERGAYSLLGHAATRSPPSFDLRLDQVVLYGSYYHMPSLEICHIPTLHSRQVGMNPQLQLQTIPPPACILPKLFRSDWQLSALLDAFLVFFVLRSWHSLCVAARINSSPCEKRLGIRQPCIKFPLAVV